MRISLQVVVDTEGDTPATVTEIAQFEREGFDAGSLGLHLAEAKSLLSRLQRTMVDGIPPSPEQKTNALPLSQPPLWRGLLMWGAVLFSYMSTLFPVAYALPGSRPSAPAMRHSRPTRASPRPCDHSRALRGHRARCDSADCAGRRCPSP